MRTFKNLMILVVSTLIGAFLLPVNVYASPGKGSVSALIPEGWQTDAKSIEVSVEEYPIYDEAGEETLIGAKKVEAAIGNGKFIDITKAMCVTIDHNCTLKLKATYLDGNVISNELEIKNFDLEIPSFKASVQGEIMYLEATDEISGVAGINVNGRTFTELTDGKMCVNLKDYEETEEYMDIYALDIAGNKSKEYKLKNPYFVGKIESGQEDKSLDNPDSVEATDPTKARGTVTDDFVTNEREFYTVDASGKTFYLIVDRSEQQENVFLLTEAGVNDLLNFTDYNGVEVQNGDIPMYEIPTSNNRKTEQQETPKEETREEKPKADVKEAVNTNSTSMFVIVALVCLVVVAYYFVKKKKRKEDLEEAEEMDAFDVPEEEPEEVEYEEEEEFEDDIPVADEETSEGEAVSFGSDIVPEVAENNDDAEKARLMAYFGKDLQR